MTDHGEAMRNMALAQMAEGLRKMGVAEDRIAAAVAEAKRTGNNHPLIALMPVSPFG